MSQPERTSTQFLEDLRNPRNARAWSAFDARYRPVLTAMGRRLGMSGDDAAELAQRTLIEFARAYAAGKYDRSKGRLSSWLIGMSRRVASGMRRSRAVHAAGAGDSRIAELPDDPELTRLWVEERQRAVMDQAIARLRAATRAEERSLKAFELAVLRGMPVEHVAAECGMTLDAVYVIKHRLTRRLRELVAEITSDFDEGRG